VNHVSSQLQFASGQLPVASFQFFQFPAAVLPVSCPPFRRSAIPSFRLSAVPPFTPLFSFSVF
jgi:hypothetical protein